eukprot:3447296-Pyramimonas_sp.AAC.1
MLSSPSFSACSAPSRSSALSKRLSSHFRSKTAAEPPPPLSGAATCCESATAAACRARSASARATAARCSRSSARARFSRHFKTMETACSRLRLASRQAPDV